MKSYYIHNLDPILFRWDESELSWYWLMYLVGFWIVLFLALRLEKERITTLHRNEILDSIMFGWFGILFGAHIGFGLIYQPRMFFENPSMFYKVWIGGMSFHGALVGVILTTWAVSVWKKKSFFAFTDMGAVTIPMALFFGRIGNFINGELVGRPSNLPWAVIFPHYDHLPRHPSQLYEAIAEGLITFIILWFTRKHLEKQGHQSGLFLVLYGFFRILLENVREPDPQIGYIASYFTMGQLLSIFMVIVGLILVGYSRRKST